MVNCLSKNCVVNPLAGFYMDNPPGAFSMVNPQLLFLGLHGALYVKNHMDFN